MNKIKKHIEFILTFGSAMTLCGLYEFFKTWIWNHPLEATNFVVAGTIGISILIGMWVIIKIGEG